ncbi:hypothetical protein Tco_1237772 [Tanacetum coccineum]
MVVTPSPCNLGSQHTKLEEDKAAAKGESANLKAQPSFPNVQQLTELMNLQVDFPADILEIPTKLNEFTNTLSALTSKIKKLEGFKLELLDDLLAFPGHLSNITSRAAKLKVLDSITDIMNKPKPIKEFTYITEFGEKLLMIKEDIEKQKSLEELAKAEAVGTKRRKGEKFIIKALGQDVVEKFYKQKVMYNKYCFRLLNRRALGKITNYDMLTRGNGPINLKVYRNDDSTEVICNFKVSDLHVSEWKEVLDACANRTRTELDLTCPLEEQDLIRLNLLAKRKRKNLDELQDYFKSTKRYKQYVQFSAHPARTMLKKPALGVILFNTQNRQDFININDFGELNIEILYNVQDIFHILHQGPGMNDLARTFSSLLIAGVDKRNLNPNKQIRVIEQLR